jgi:formylmethanofuran dehydrogenase subunit E
MSIEDKAQEHEAMIWEQNNRARSVARFNPGEAGYGPAECEDCGEEVHAVRRSYGFTTCTPCASARERLSR